MKKLIVLMILPLMFTIGCTDDEKVLPSNANSTNNSKSSDLFGLKSFSSIDQESDVVIHASSMHGINTEYSIYADFKNSSGNYVSVTNFSVNGTSPTYKSSINAYGLSTDLTSSELNYFGDSITIDVNGSPFGNYQSKIYNPGLIKITGIIQNGVNIVDSTSHFVEQFGDITITWNSDPNFDEDILLLLIPRPNCFDGDKRCEIAGLSVIQTLITNNGSYIISDNFMENFNNISSDTYDTDRFDLILGTANQKIIEHEIDIETVITVFNYDSYSLPIIE